jgi:cell division protein ZapA
MSEDRLIPINVWIAGRSYRIRIKPEEEEIVRKSVKLADGQIAELRDAYAGKDDQDFVAMCLVMYAANTATEGDNVHLAEDAVTRMIGRIDSALGSEAAGDET